MRKEEKVHVLIAFINLIAFVGMALYNIFTEQTWISIIAMLMFGIILIVIICKLAWGYANYGGYN